MSQTTPSGQSGEDPDKDEWLKQFTGLPETYETDELSNDRPYFDEPMRQRAPGLSIEGQIETMGDALHNAKERWDGESSRSSRGGVVGSILLALFIAALVFALAAGIVSI